MQHMYNKDKFIYILINFKTTLRTRLRNKHFSVSPLCGISSQMKT